MFQTCRKDRVKQIQVTTFLQKCEGQDKSGPPSPIRKPTRSFSSSTCQFYIAQEHPALHWDYGVYTDANLTHELHSIIFYEASFPHLMRHTVSAGPFIFSIALENYSCTIWRFGSWGRCGGIQSIMLPGALWRFNCDTDEAVIN